MSESLLAMAKDLALAQIQAGHVIPEDMTSVLNSTYETLQQLSANEDSATAVLAPPSPKSWKKSITKHAVTCLECGASFRQLSTRHLRMHDMDGRTYRKKHGIPQTQSLSSKDVYAKRLAIVNQTKPWEKSPTSGASKETVTEAQPTTPKKTVKKAAPKRRKRAQTV